MLIKRSTACQHDRNACMYMEARLSL